MERGHCAISVFFYIPGAALSVNRPNERCDGIRVCVCVCACVRACVHACVRACVCPSVYLSVTLVDSLNSNRLRRGNSSLMEESELSIYDVYDSSIA
jgi:hypothetical protein